MNNKPASYVIADNLRELIRNKAISTNSPIPSEIELCKAYNVSRATAQKALSMLTAEHLIYHVQGKGYYVNPVDVHMYNFSYDEFKDCDIQLISIHLIFPPPEVIYNLHVHPKKRVVEIKRRVLSNNDTIAFDVKYVPYNPINNNFEDISNYNNFGNIIASGYTEQEIQRDIRIYSETTDETAADVLNIPENSDIVVLEQLLTSDEEPLGWGKTYYKPDYFCILAERESYK